MHDSPKQAEQHRKRSRSVVKDISTLDLLTDKDKQLCCTKPDGKVEDVFRFPAYDVMSLLSVMMPITKNNKKENQQ